MGNPGPHGVQRHVVRSQAGPLPALPGCQYILFRLFFLRAGDLLSPHFQVFPSLLSSDNLQIVCRLLFLVTEFPTGPKNLALYIRISCLGVQWGWQQLRGFLGGLQKIQTECPCESSLKTWNRESIFSTQATRTRSLGATAGLSSPAHYTYGCSPHLSTVCWLDQTEAYSFPGPRAELKSYVHACFSC